MTLLINPAQARGIAAAVKLLEVRALSDDEMVHISELHDGTNGLRVELTSVDKRYYVADNGELYETKRELQDAE